MNNTPTTALAFEPGNIVCLKSGSPEMTVAAASDTEVRCVYFDEYNHSFDASTFSPVLLTLSPTRPAKA